MSAATVAGRVLAPSVIAELCNADQAARSPHVRLYRADAAVVALEADQ